MEMEGGRKRRRWCSLSSSRSIIETKEEGEEEEESRKRKDMERRRTHPVAEDREGVLSLILLRMPLHKVFELRTVSRLWRSLLSSTFFLQEWERIHRRLYVTMRVTQEEGGGAYYEELLAYDDAARCWSNLGNLLVDRLRRIDPILGTLTPRRIVDHMAYSRRNTMGIICMVREDTLQILVFNPVTGSHSVVPLPHRFSRLLAQYSFADCQSLQKHNIVFMEEDNSTALLLHHHPQPQQQQPEQHFRILLIDNTLDQRILQMYSSRHGSWGPETPHRLISSPCLLPPPIKIQFPRFFIENDSVYVSGYSELEDGMMGFLDASSVPFVKSLSKYNSWIIQYKSGYIFFSHCGRLLAAIPKPGVALTRDGGGGEEEDDSDVFQGFCLLEMRLKPWPSSSSASQPFCIALMDWVEIASTPLHLWKGFYPQRHAHGAPRLMHTQITYAAGLVCMTAGYNDEQTAVCDPIHITATRPLIYDIDACSWYPMPPAPPPTKKKYPCVCTIYTPLHSAGNPHSVITGICPSFLVSPPGALPLSDVEEDELSPVSSRDMFPTEEGIEAPHSF